MSEDEGISVRAFLRDLRWLLPLALGASVLMVFLNEGWAGYHELLEVLMFTGLVSSCSDHWFGWGGRSIFTRYARDRRCGGSLAGPSFGQSSRWASSS